MSKPKLFITAFAVVLCFLKANAQTDSTHFDLGRLLLRKDFTQNITVKGADLEKMPFTNLANAINVWFYGSYTNASSIVYVIDGNVANDANAYNIQDIEEVTLVQNALSNGLGKQVVLIKTKRQKGNGSGVTASGQASISNLYTNNIYNYQTNSYEKDLKSTTTLYQEYYISAYKNTDNIQFGVSVNYLRDALPEIKMPGLTYKEQLNLNRFRLNGYFDAKIGRSMLQASVGYVPQTEGSNYESVSTLNETSAIDQNFMQSQHLVNASVKLTTPILPGLTNIVHADYNNSYTDNKYLSSTLFNNQSSVILSEQAFKSRDIVAYDNLNYNLKFGNWALEPQVNLSYKTLKDSTNLKTYDLNNDGPGPVSFYYFTHHGHMFVLTPSINLYYKNYFNIEGGIIYNLANRDVPLGYAKRTKLYPFVSASADIAKLADPTTSLSVKVYGSYSLNSYFNDDNNFLNDITNSMVQLPLFDGYPNSTQAYPLGYTTLIGNQNYEYGVEYAKSTFKTFAAGLSISPFKSLIFSYYFDQRNYLTPVNVMVPESANSTGSILVYTNTNATLHRFAIDYTLQTTLFKWQTGLSANMQISKYPQFSPQVSPVRGKGTWTGGWVNRLTYRDFFAGVDIFYQFWEKTRVLPASYITINKTANINSFSLQNLYAGCHLKVAGLKNMEVFANARNAFQSQKTDITDNRRYYGVGFKLSL